MCDLHDNLKKWLWHYDGIFPGLLIFRINKIIFGNERPAFNLNKT